MSDQTIQNLNNQKALENVLGIVLISISMIVGISGNVIVLCVYLRKYKPSTHRTFIVCLAMIGLASCSVSIPFFITVLRYPIEFSNDADCKIFHFLNFCLIMGSGFILVTIATERHRKICTPHGKQLLEKMFRYVCVIDLFLAGLLSWPGAVLYGTKTYTVGIGGIKGTECNVSDDFVGTNYPAYFGFVLLFLFIASVISISIMYTVIGKQVWKVNKRSYRTNQPDASTTNVAKTQITELPCSKFAYNAAATQSSEDKSNNMENNSISILSTECKGEKEIIPVDIKQTYNTTKPNVDKGNMTKKGRIKTIAFTRIFFIITVVLFVSFLPNWALSVADFLNRDFRPNTSFTEIVAYQTFRWSLFINSIANPIIYGFCDRKFRQEVCQMFGLKHKYPEL